MISQVKILRYLYNPRPKIDFLNFRVHFSSSTSKSNETNKDRNIVHFDSKKTELWSKNECNPFTKDEIKLGSAHREEDIRKSGPKSELNVLVEASLSCICSTDCQFHKTSNEKSGDGPCAPQPPATLTPYDMRKFKHDLPGCGFMPNFEPLFNMPTEIFRCTAGEVLGPYAHKCGCYLNPEYYSFHYMSFYDMHLMLSTCRQPQRDSQRKS